MRSLILLFVLAATASGALAAEESTSTFLTRCQRTDRCEGEIYFLLDGDPILNTKYRCLFEANEQPLVTRIVNWLRTNKSQSNEGLLQDLYAALEALRVENLDGACNET